MNLTFSDLLTLSQLIENQGENATEDQRAIYVKVKEALRDQTGGCGCGNCERVTTRAYCSKCKRFHNGKCDK